VVAYTDPSEIGKRILEESECIGDVPGYTGCDIIAMVTHGRHGLQHLLEGSITEHVLDSTVLPLFIVHAQRSDEKLPSLAGTAHA
jgi:nucleotide-binding universal stress UspA family protein